MSEYPDRDSNIDLKIREVAQDQAEKVIRAFKFENIARAEAEKAVEREFIRYRFEPSEAVPIKQESYSWLVSAAIASLLLGSFTVVAAVKITQLAKKVDEGEKEKAQLIERVYSLKDDLETLRYEVTEGELAR